MLVKYFKMIFVSIASAQGGVVVQPGNSSPGNLPNPLGYDNLLDLLNGIMGKLIIIAAPIVTIMVLYGAFKIMTAGDNPDRVKEGKNVILYAAIGYAILLVGSGFIYVIKELLGGP